MSKVRFYLLGIIISAVFLQARASENTYSQVWSGVGVSKEINSKFELGFDKEIRFESGINNKNFDKMTFAARYDVTRWMQLGLEYWRGQIRSGSEWRREQKPVLIAKINYKVYNIEWSVQQKMEYRFIEKYDNIPVYKFRPQIKYNFRDAGILSEAYINNELFFNLRANGFYLNRMRAGVKLKYGVLSPDINYVFQMSDKKDGWQTIHALAVKVWLQF